MSKRKDRMNRHNNQYAGAEKKLVIKKETYNKLVELLTGITKLNLKICLDADSIAYADSKYLYDETTGEDVSYTELAKEVFESTFSKAELKRAMNFDSDVFRATYTLGEDDVEFTYNTEAAYIFWRYLKNIIECATLLTEYDNANIIEKMIVNLDLVQCLMQYRVAALICKSMLDGLIVAMTDEEVEEINRTKTVVNVCDYKIEEIIRRDYETTYNSTVKFVCCD